MRASGILLPVASLPSRYGIGCFSKEAYEFVDRLEEAGQSYWQILPLGPTGYGDSPYQSFSTFAGNPYFIDLETLVKEGLLTEEECDACDFGDNAEYIDYEKIYLSRFKVLRKAFERFAADDVYDAFVSENGYWLEDYALYMAIKDALGGISWSEWPAELKDREEAALNQKREELAEEIAFYKFQQFMFLKQWKALKAYANEKGIRIIGDIPIYVAFDGADTWASPELFQFDEENNPVAVAGCPPDDFSATGQLWGNPLYNWEYHKKTGYAWWMKRIRHCVELYDVIRIDHFRGFDSYYAIPGTDDTARNGEWREGPGMDLFHALEKKLGKLNIIVEDLGFLTPSVLKLVKDSGFPGMKVVQFAFDSREGSDYLPHNYPTHCVVYTGTHDNDTILGWMNTAPKASVKFAKEYLNLTKEEGYNWGMMRGAWASVGDLAIVPMQDIIGVGSEGRMNTPSTLGGNWEWRATADQIDNKLTKHLYKYMQMYGRVRKDMKEEAKEEAEYVLNMIKPYQISGPVAIDVEEIFDDTYRQMHLSASQLTDVIITFCDRIKEAGYTPMIYSNLSSFIGNIELDRLENYEKWLAYYSDEPYFPYEMSMWQYTDSGSIDGITGNVDLNISFKEWN